MQKKEGEAGDRVEVSVNATGSTEGINEEVSSIGCIVTGVLSFKDDRMQENVTGSNDEAEKESEDESIRDDDSCIDVDVGRYGDLYTVEQINSFLDETKGRSVDVEEVFPDLEKFIASVMKARKECNVEILSQQKIFRLKKHLTAVRQKIKKMKGKRRSTRTSLK